jgi:predicted tellurium resistance membrane protein TerC
VLKLMDRFPAVITIGAGLLGWIGGGMLLQDVALQPHLSGWPTWAHYVSAALGALLVIGLGKGLSAKTPASDADTKLK